MKPKKYKDLNFTPPKCAQKAAIRGLKIRAAQTPSNRCCTPVGIARARDLKNGGELSANTIRRMARFARHEENYNPKDLDAKGSQAWLLSGGSCGVNWAKRVVKQMKEIDKK